MQPKELRIGNFVYDSNNQIKEIVSIGNHEVTVHNVGGDGLDPKEERYPFSDLHPIPLSADVVEKIKIKLFTIAQSFRLHVNSNGTIEMHQYGEGKEALAHIKYLHELQNLTLLLSSKELEVDIEEKPSELIISQ